ncbi:MAG: LptF/LptG family permease [Candidatus Velthaea sp.]
MAAFTGVGNDMLVRTDPRPPWHLPILDSYILREMGPPFVFAFGTFLLFWFVNIFFLAADYVINKGAPLFVVLRFLVFRVPQATPMAFPFSCLFATLMAFGRLMADNEITALRTSGVRFLRIVRFPVIAGVAAFGLSYLINEKIVPVSTDLSTRTFYQIVYKVQSLPIEPDIYRHDPSTGNTFYVGSVDPDNRTMHNVQIFKPGGNRPGTLIANPFKTVISAQSGQLVGSKIVLKNAVVTTFNDAGGVSGVVTEKTAEIGLPLAESAQNFLSSAYNDPYTMDSKRLKQDIDLRKVTGQGGSDLASREITLAQKLAYPFASFIAVLIALPLAVKFGKKGRALGIALSIVMMFVYWGVGAMAAAFGRNHTIDPYVAAWLPNVLMAAAGGYLILNEDR